MGRNRALFKLALAAAVVFVLSIPPQVADYGFLLWLLSEIGLVFGLVGMGATWIIALSMAGVCHEWAWLAGMVVLPPLALLYLYRQGE